MVSDAALRLESAIAPYDSALVAYSGGVDSTVVLVAAHAVLGVKAVGVVAESASLPRAELEAALALARDRGIKVEVLTTSELDVPGYVANGPDRCYFCKTELYGELAGLATRRGVATVFDGFNRDDRADWRPGRKAAVEHGVRSPLDEAGLGKAEVRALAREWSLPNWDKPAAACLSSRIAYGVPVSVAALERVERAEALVRQLGFRQVRVRDLGGPATVEVEPEAAQRLADDADLVARVEAGLSALGFESVVVDPAGYRQGSLNRRA